jgi:hypothetical protein
MRISPYNHVDLISTQEEIERTFHVYGTTFSKEGEEHTYYYGWYMFHEDVKEGDIICLDKATTFVVKKAGYEPGFYTGNKIRVIRMEQVCQA